MKTALIYFTKRSHSKAKTLLPVLYKAAEKRCGNIVLLDGYHLTDSDRLVMYEYIAVFVMDKPFFGTAVDSAFIAILNRHGVRAGIKGCVITMTNGLFSAKFSRKIMEKTEALGIRLDYSEILKTEADAQRAGNNIG